MHAGSDAAVTFTNYRGIVAAVGPDLGTSSSGGRTPPWILDFGLREWPINLVTSWTPRVAAHEMGHGYGLPHSRGQSSDYGDAWDAMSFPGHSFWTESGPAGPGLNARNRRQLGWLTDAQRVVWTGTCSVGICSQTFTLSSLTRPLSAPPPAGARFLVEIPYGSGQFTVELRLKESWDSGLPRPAIVVREVRSDGLSYLPTYPAEIGAGEHFRHPGRNVHIHVDQIDTANRTATVTIDRNAYIPPPPPPGDDPIDPCNAKPWMCG